MPHTGTGGAPDNAGPLNYSTNYVWNTADLLGKGATASVYLGRSRKSGKVVAIKAFERESRHIAQARCRELELLRSVDHKNVIRLYTYEPELSSGNQMLVMAYCQGGSVYSMLEQPQYAFGFPDDEFLKLFKHIASGLKYLRSKGIIHRDIKPGNIMRMIEEDGGTLYVLTDFGAARALDEEEMFMSVYGTEEYLHPDMFRRAVLRQHSGEQFFNSSVDLWSLGVTLYHVITGTLPFKPHGGRGNAQTMFQITSSREAGVISGIQKEADGPIEWSKELPATCLLSRCLKKKVEPVLAALFQAKENYQHATPFDACFTAVDDITTMLKITVFNYQDGCALAVYVRRNERYAHLKEEIALLTNIPADNQLLVASSRNLEDTVDIEAELQAYPISVLNNPVYLYEKGNYEVHRLHDAAIPPFPSFPEDSTLAIDSRVSKSCAAVSYYIVHMVNDALANQTMLQESVIHLRQYICHKLLPVELCVPEFDKLLTETKKRLQTLSISQKHMDSVVNIIGSFSSEFRKFMEKKCYWRTFCTQETTITSVIQKSDSRVEEVRVYMSVLNEKLREQGNTNAFNGLPCHHNDQCASKIVRLHENIVSVTTTFSKHKRYGELHRHEVFIHTVERENMEEHCVKVLSQLQGHCRQNLSRVYVVVQRLISLLLKHLTRADKVETNMKCVIDCQRQISDRIDKMDDGYRNAISKLQEMLPQILSAQQSRDVRGNWSQPLTNEKCEKCSMSRATGDGSSRAESSMIDELVAEMTSLQTETTEVDDLVKSNTQALLSLKRILQDTGTLDPASADGES